MNAAMSDRCRHQPPTLPSDGTAIAVPPALHEPARFAWRAFVELRQGGGQRSTRLILLEQVADASRVASGKDDWDEVDGEHAYATADSARRVYDVSGGLAGFVSFALPASAAGDVRALAAAARRTWYRARRPNVLVQIPATAAGINAVFRLIPEAISVHATQIVSYETYRLVAEAYVAGLRHRAECGLPISGIASFATLAAYAEVGHLERAVGAYAEIFSDAAFGDLRRLGARTQTVLRRPVW